MRRTQALALAAAALALACGSGTSAPEAGAAPRPVVAGGPPEIDGKTPLPDPLPEIAAKVNGSAVPTRNVRQLAENALQKGAIPADQKAFAYRKAMHQFVIRELLFQEAVARGLNADQAQLDQTENQERGRFKTAAEWQQALAQQGLDEEAFKLELRVQLTVNALVQKIHEGVSHDSITDAELQKYYTENADQFTARDRIRAAHILIRGAGASKAEARKKAEGILADVRGGGDFAALARKHSQDPASAPNGGEMPPFGRGQMGPELASLEQALQALKPGEVGEVVESAAGFHVVKLLERLPDEVLPLEPMKEELRHHLVGQRRNEAVQNLVNELRAKAKIETFL